MNDEGHEYEAYLPRNVVVFTIGALFLASTIAATQEIEVIATQIGWPRTLSLGLLSIGVMYLTEDEQVDF